MSIHVSSNSEGTRTFRLTVATRVRGNSDYSFAEEVCLEHTNLFSVSQVQLIPNYYYATAYSLLPAMTRADFTNSSIPQYFCTPYRIRTCDPQIRNLLLYPAELREQFSKNHCKYSNKKSNFQIKINQTYKHSAMLADFSVVDLA